MAFDPVTLLTLSVVVLVAVGALMLRWARGPQGCGALRWTGAAFLCLALGFAVLLATPDGARVPGQVLGCSALLLGYGLFWAASRAFNRRPLRVALVAAGPALYLGLSLLLQASPAVTLGAGSALIAAYSMATAREHRSGEPADMPSQPLAAWIFLLQGSFFLLRAVFGPDLGFAPWDVAVSQPGGALLGLETVLAAVLFGAVAVAMSRERIAGLHRREALEDPLTGVGNRRALFRSGAALVDAALAEGRPAALLLMDLDGFKAVNDLHGHGAGDRLLVAFARVAHDYLPPTSLVCRVGGEEFAAVLPGADPARARAVADEIRALFAHVAIAGPHGPVRATVSIGIAQAQPSPGGTRGLEDLLARADRCLYAAKGGGRNRVVAEPRHPEAAGVERSAA